MDLTANNVFLLMAAVWLAFFTLRLLRTRPLVEHTWIAVCTLQGLVLLAGCVAFREVAGFVSAGLFALLVLTPGLANRPLQRLIAQGRFAAARRWSLLVELLHPSRMNRLRGRILAALARAASGDFAPIHALLDATQARPEPILQQLRIAALMALSEWDQIAQSLAQSPPPAGHAASAWHALVAARADFERGMTQQALARVEQLVSERVPIELELSLQMALLTAAAFTGQESQVRALLPQFYERDSIQGEYLLTLARTQAGEPTTAEWDRLLARSDGDSLMRRKIERRLALARTGTPVDASPAQQALLQRLQQAAEQRSRLGLVGIQRVRPIATWGLAAALAAVFALQLARGALGNPDALYALGALSLRGVTQGEGWRLLTYNFLHMGWLHFGLNLTFLLLIGPSLERAIGAWRYLAVYLASGVGAGAIFVAWNRLGSAYPAQQFYIIVGASGCLMGLIGGMIAFYLVAWLRERALIARDRFRMLAVLIVIQFASDRLFPQISSAIHLLGFALGFLLVGAMESLRRRR